jgi:hypothetical protein
MLHGVHGIVPAHHRHAVVHEPICRLPMLRIPQRVHAACGPVIRNATNDLLQRLRLLLWGVHARCLLLLLRLDLGAVHAREDLAGVGKLLEVAEACARVARDVLPPVTLPARHPIRAALRTSMHVSRDALQHS